MNLTQLLLQSNINIKELTSKELVTLQHFLLDIFNDIYYACEKHGLQLMLSGGCCLGAIRHRGFIPWDDDMDIMLMREDYKRLPQALSTEFGNKYQCIGPNISTETDMSFMRIEKPGTILRSIYDHPNQNKPVFIDVFPIDNIPNNRFIRCYNAIIADSLHYVALCIKYYNYLDSPAVQLLLKNDGKNEIRKRLIIGKIFSIFTTQTKVFNIFDKFISRHTSNTIDVGVPCSRRYLREIYPRETILPVIKLPFENILAPLPQKYDIYLKTLYDNYMQLPPEDQRKHAFWIEIKL